MRRAARRRQSPGVEPSPLFSMWTIRREPVAHEDGRAERRVALVEQIVGKPLANDVGRGIARESSTWQATAAARCRLSRRDREEPPASAAYVN